MNKYINQRKLLKIIVFALILTNSRTEQLYLNFKQSDKRENFRMILCKNVALAFFVIKYSNFNPFEIVNTFAQIENKIDYIKCRLNKFLYIYMVLLHN